MERDPASGLDSPPTSLLPVHSFLSFLVNFILAWKDYSKVMKIMFPETL